MRLASAVPISTTSFLRNTSGRSLQGADVGEAPRCRAPATGCRQGDRRRIEEVDADCRSRLWRTARLVRHARAAITPMWRPRALIIVPANSTIWYVINMPFEPGNKLGRGRTPARKSLTEALRVAIAERLPDGRTVNRAIADAVVTKAMAGDIRAIREIADRVEGRPALQIDLRPLMTGNARSTSS